MLLSLLFHFHNVRVDLYPCHAVEAADASVTQVDTLFQRRLMV